MYVIHENYLIIHNDVSTYERLTSILILRYESLLVIIVALPNGPRCDLRAVTYERTSFSFTAVLKGRRKPISLDRFILKRPAIESEKSVFMRQESVMVKKKVIRRTEKNYVK